jgi:RNA polymerase-binding transcription factor DksA
MTDDLADPRLRRVLEQRDAGPVTERALEKAGGGTYGMCDRCGGPIPRARLLAVPESVLCLGCADASLPAVG